MVLRSDFEFALDDLSRTGVRFYITINSPYIRISSFPNTPMNWWYIRKNSIQALYHKISSR